MRKILFSLIATLVFVSAAGSANASLFSDALSFNGKRDRMIDESIGLVVDRQSVGSAGHGLVSVGDVIQSIARFVEVDPDGPGNSTIFPGTLFAITSMEVIAVDTTSDPGFATVVLGKMSLANAAFSISSILSTAGIITTGIVTSGDEVLALVESNSGESFSLDEFDATSGFVTAAGVGTKLDKDWDATLTANLERGDDFHEIKVDLGAPGDISPIVIADLEAGTSETGDDKRFASYRSAFSVEDTNFFADPDDFLDLSVNDTSGTAHESHIVTSGNNVIGAFNTDNDANFLAKGWHFADDGNFDINGTPEPATLGMWAAIGGIAGLYVRRRRKARKA